MQVCTRIVPLEHLDLCLALLLEYPERATTTRKVIVVAFLTFNFYVFYRGTFLLTQQFGESFHDRLFLLQGFLDAQVILLFICVASLAATI